MNELGDKEVRNRGPDISYVRIVVCSFLRLLPISGISPDVGLDSALLSARSQNLLCKIESRACLAVVRPLYRSASLFPLRF